MDNWIGITACLDWIGITACLEELAHFLFFLREISVVATKTSQSKELRVRDGVLTCAGWDDECSK